MMGWLKPSKAWKRMISVLTILALLITTMPVSLAADIDTTRQASQRQALLAEEETLEPTAEPTPTPEVSETAIPDPTPDPSGEPEPTVTPEESVSPEPSLSPSPSPLPYDLPGMPADFVLSDDQLHAKEVMSTKDIVSVTEALTPGEDYVDNQVMFWAESKEYAETVAAAYNGELVSYSNHIALVELQSTTVTQALTVAADTTNNMPALDANHIITLDPGEKNMESKAGFDFSTQAEAPSKQSWFDRPNDPFLQYPNEYEYQWMHDVVNTYEAWGVTTGSSSIKVAVIDSGVRTTHEDLSGKVTIIDMIGVPIDDETNVESNDDKHGHGTHVAGIIAATSDNGKGGAGIAPGVSILSVAALPGGYGSDYCISVGIGRAVDAGAHIINMSFGGYLYNGTLDDAIQDAIDNNVACIAAMGNDGSNSYSYPAAYSGVIAVAAVNSDYTRANFSNYGSWADVAAPGVDIMSSTIASNSSYESWDGTSMATPVVSGVAALYLSMVGRISPSTLEKKLESCVTKSSSSSIGAGIVDASKLFSADKTPPKITVKNTLGNVITSFTAPIPQESTLTIESGTGATNAKMIIYTTDGSTPSVKNGEVYNGFVYDGEINLASFQAGKPITFKAVCISGMGVMSSSASVKFTLSLNSSISSLTLSGVNKITAGGKATYTAAVLPTISVSQKVLWSIVNRTNAVKATISSTGILTTYAKDGGEVTIRATSVINPAKYVEKVVTIEAIPFLKSIKLDTVQIAATYPDGASSEYPIGILSATNALNAPVDPAEILVKWSSSNTKVATVNDIGEVFFVGSGTATIKCTALDGSGKYATCAVTVTQRVESIAVTGQNSIAPGKTVTYKATVLPTNAKTKSVAWMLEGAPDGVTISTSGAVKVPSTVSGGSFTVVAAAKDGSGAYGSKEVAITPLCTGITLTSGDDRVIRNSASTILSASIFTCDVDTTIDADDVLVLGYSINGNSTTPVWTSSAPTIASVDQSGMVIGHKAGSATITCATQDGSGKKAAMKVTVNVPTSYLTVGTKMPLMEYEEPTIAFGKSATNTVAYGDTYGTPTSKKVTWSYEIWEYDDEGNDFKEVTEELPGRVSLSSSGVLKVSSAMFDDWWATPVGYGFKVVVTATSADGSNVSDSLVYWTQPATNIIIPLNRVEYWEPEDDMSYGIYFASDSDLNDYTVTSSNPKVAGLISGVYYDSSAPDSDYPYLVPIYTGVPGTAVITIKSNDGSGKYATVVIYVGYWE